MSFYMKWLLNVYSLMLQFFKPPEYIRARNFVDVKHDIINLEQMNQKQRSSMVSRFVKQQYVQWFIAREARKEWLLCRMRGNYQHENGVGSLGGGRRQTWTKRWDRIAQSREAWEVIVEDTIEHVLLYQGGCRL